MAWQVVYDFDDLVTMELELFLTEIDTLKNHVLYILKLPKKHSAIFQNDTQLLPYQQVFGRNGILDG